MLRTFVSEMIAVEQARMELNAAEDAIGLSHGMNDAIDAVTEQLHGFNTTEALLENTDESSTAYTGLVKELTQAYVGLKAAAASLSTTGKEEQERAQALFKTPVNPLHIPIKENFDNYYAISSALVAIVNSVVSSLRLMYVSENIPTE